MQQLQLQQVPNQVHSQTHREEQPSLGGAFVGGGQQPLGKFDSHPYDGPINFRALFWVDRGPTVWALQTTIAVICFIEAILMQYLTYKVAVGPLPSTLLIPLAPSTQRTLA